MFFSSFFVRELYVLYGSQTGNSEDIAKNIYEKCSGLGFSTTLLNLNAAKKIPLKEKALAIIIGYSYVFIVESHSNVIFPFHFLVCSTTGNGDAPENADAFWRMIKNRSAAKDMFANIPYATLGLGDTNYDKFCYMGKSLDKRMSELGGVRLIDLACADEATNMEEVVENWKTNIMIAIKKLAFSCLNSNECTLSSIVTATENKPCESMSIKFENEQKSIIAKGVLPFSKICRLIGITEDTVSGSPDSDKLPKSRIVNDESIQIINTSTSTPMTSRDPPCLESESGWCVECPYVSQVINAKWLTKAPAANASESLPWGSEKRIVQLELSLGDSAMSYQPGDSIGICCPNPDYIVKFLIERLNKNALHKQQHLSCETKVAWKGEHLSLGELLSYR